MEDPFATEKQRGGGKLRGGENIPWIPSPKNGFGPPHLWYDLPPPFVHAMSFSLEETGADQTKSLSEASKTGFWGGALWYVSPPKNRAIRFARPFANSQPMTVLTILGHFGPAQKPEVLFSPSMRARVPPLHALRLGREASPVAPLAIETREGRCEHVTDTRMWQCDQSCINVPPGRRHAS